MQNRSRIAGMAGVLCLVGSLGCITTYPTPPPPGYCIPYGPPTAYQPPPGTVPQTVSPSNPCGPCAQGWRPATTPP